MNLSDLKIGVRLAIGFAVILTLLCAVAATGSIGISSLDGTIKEMRQERYLKTVQANNVIDAVNKVERNLRDAYIYTGAEQQRALSTIDPQRKIIAENLEKLTETVRSESGETLLKKVGDARSAYRGSQDRFIELLKADKRDVVTLMQGGLRKTQSDFLDLVSEMIKFQSDAMEERGKHAEQAAINAERLLIILSVITGLLTIVFAFLIARSITGPTKLMVEGAERMAVGDFNFKLGVHSKDELGMLANSVRSIQAAVQAMSADAAMLAKAAVEGKLEMRAGAARHQGDFRKIVEGVNNTLEAVSGPLIVAASYVDRISKGSIPKKITDSYAGDFNALKINLNVCIDAINALVADANMLARAAVEGELETRAYAAKHQGEFRKIVQGANDTLDAIVGPVSEVVRVLGALSKGDLSEKITAQYKGTFEQLKSDANQTVEKLTEIVTQIKESTESINVAAKEIASGNTALSSRTKKQASSLEDTAACLEELTGTVKQNAANAKQANQLAVGASEVAVKGGNVVGQVVTTMSSINESSKKIAEIVSVIDGIASQTNILALNAAVEAARAGEQGRTFAVVAAEVRTLAQRSAAAAKEIKELVSDSVEKVDAGTKLADKAGTTMREIVSSVKRVTDIMVEITAASQEQSAGIEQVNAAIMRVGGLKQQNAAMVEQAAAAAESMQVQAGNLAAAVSIFKLTQQMERVTVVKPAVAKPPTAKPEAAKLAALHSPRKPLTLVQNHAHKGNGQLSPVKPMAVKATDADEWTEI